MSYTNQTMEYIDLGIETLEKAKLLVNSIENEEEMHKLLCLIKDTVQNSLNPLSWKLDILLQKRV